MVQHTEIDLFHSVRNLQRKRRQLLGSGGFDLRIEALKKIKQLLVENEAEWLNALEQDLHKPPLEAYASEIAVLLNELDYIIKHLKQWMQPTVKHRLLLSGLEKTTLIDEAYGSVLILAPWNYPLQLALAPVIGAIAAGNGAVLKPSESAPAVSYLLNKLVPKYLDPDLLFVVEGDSQTAQTLTSMEWDFVFFTGSPQTGKKVYQAAAKHLTPVIMELGGKNPCIVDESAFNKDTIEKIIWGKFLNAGQTCVAPDTVYVPESLYEAFLEQFKQTLVEFYGENPNISPDYGRIIHNGHLDALKAFLEDGTVYYGGEVLEDDLFISPTLMVDIKAGSPLAQEEIFGPILPIVPYRSLDEVIDQYQALPVPLVVYLFTKSDSVVQTIQRKLESGAVSVNQVMVHVKSPNAPFGGKGHSGIGNYHGLASYKAFTYPRTLYQKHTPFTLNQQFPPYTQGALTALKRFRRYIF